mmetsp:Transcript_31303/g.72994  ORF Transcript_31303/g.72994 Transcript_31303/m.72994 type:complete len:246 (-) Transcript_31303:118-855(-)
MQPSVRKPRGSASIILALLLAVVAAVARFGGDSMTFAFGARRIRDLMSQTRRGTQQTLICRHAARAKRQAIIRKVPKYKTAKDLPAVGIPDEADDDEYKYGNYKFPYGWNDKTRKFDEMPMPTTKWWQMPGYLTPNGYSYPPHWHIETYELCVKETAYARLEAELLKDLEEREGWSWREVRDRCSVYEIIEDDANPMTDKMKFLLQVQALWMGVDEDLLDFRENPSSSLPRQPKKLTDGMESQSA